MPEPLAGPERQQTLDQYTDSFAQRLAEKWNPRQALREYPNQVLSTGSFTTVVWVVVDELGDVVAVDVAKAVHAYVDREAIRAVHVTAPLPPPPEGLLYRSSRGLVASFPLQFTIHVPGESGAYVQNRANQEGKVQTNKPLELVAEL